jgi:uncharacterized protein (TIGR02284 family)
MTTPQTGESYENLIDELNDVIAIDHDAISAYEAAIERLESSGTQEQLEMFKADHERHVHELSDCVTMLGGEPRTKGNIKKILTKGKVVLANISGDEAILEAMKTNEDQTNQTYEEAVRRHSASAPSQVADVLKRGLQDERRHRDWIVQALQRH